MAKKKAPAAMAKKPMKKADPKKTKCSACGTKHKDGY